jgi:hypothetical protein
VSPISEGAEIELCSDAAKAKPGLNGNLIVDIFQGQALAAATKNKKQGNQRRVAVGTLPAIPFEVVEPLAPPAKPVAKSSAAINLSQ